MWGQIISAIIEGIAGYRASQTQANANTSIANTQANAARTAAQIEAQSQREALAAAQEQQDYERWLTSATASARQPYLDLIAQTMGIGGPGGFAPTSYTPSHYEAAQPYTPPTVEEAMADPSAQFTLKEGQKALERSASSRGTILTGGTLKDLASFTTDLTQAQYDKVNQRDLATYNTNEANRFNAWNANTSADYQAAALKQQGQYESASLAMQAYQNRLSSLFSLAGLASPGQYPGSTRRPTDPRPLNQFGVPIGSLPWQPGMQEYGGGGEGDNAPHNYVNGINSDPYGYADASLYADSIRRRNESSDGTYHYVG